MGVIRSSPTSTSAGPSATSVHARRSGWSSISVRSRHSRAPRAASFEQLPFGTVGFGLLRYLSPDEAIRRAMAALPRPEISVNYLGRHLGMFRDDDRRDQVLTPTGEPIGPTRAARQERPRLIRVLADLADGRLRILWKFSEHIHDVATIESLAASVSTSLLTVSEVAAGSGRER